MKISGIYKITNTITGDFYVGSSNDVKRRWAEHKKPSVWKKHPNNQMYLDMQRYGVDKFEFEILEETEIEKLKEKEQQFIETLNPAYNDRNANGFDFERQKKSKKKYNREYQKTDKFKECHKESQKKYDNQLCSYNGETITLAALRMRFKKLGIEHPAQEAKKYIIKR